MIFEIERVSNLWGAGNPEVEEAYEEDGTWYIKIDSLEELIELEANYGKLVIMNKSIIIYDTYME